MNRTALQEAALLLWENVLHSKGRSGGTGTKRKPQQQQQQEHRYCSGAKRFERRMATAREPALCRCTSRLAYRALDAALVLGLQIVQGSALNFFLIWHLHKNSAYFWFVGDLCVVMVSMGALLTSYHHVRLKARHRVRPMTYGPELAVKPKLPKYGAVPFAYASWLVYSGFMVAKLALLYRSGVMANLRPEDPLSPQLLRVLLTISALVFYLQVQSYHNAVPNSTRRVALLGSSLAVVLEILDSVDFVGVLIGGTFDLPYSLEAAMLALTAVNLVLPAAVLFRLCCSDFDERAEPRLLGLAHVTFKTFVVDLPFFVIRVFLWTHCNHVNVSAFLIKNALYILIWFRFSLPEGVEALKDVRRESILRQELHSVSRSEGGPPRQLEPSHLTNISTITEETT